MQIFIYALLMYYPTLLLPLAYCIDGVHAQVINSLWKNIASFLCLYSLTQNGSCEIPVKLWIITKGPLLTRCRAQVKRAYVTNWWPVRLARKARVGLSCKEKLLKIVRLPDIRHHSQAATHLPTLFSPAAFHMFSWHRAQHCNTV